MNSIDDLIAELSTQIECLPNAEPEAVESMLATLSLKLEALAKDVREHAIIDPASLQTAQLLLERYSHQLGRAMVRVQRGLEVFGLDTPIYGSPFSQRPAGVPTSINPRSFSA
ncbi:MAG: hypothetical protein ACRBC3_15465 [Burkholderiaceae bacterium]